MNKVQQVMAEGMETVHVAELTGLDRKAVDKAFAALKKEGAMCLPSDANGSLPINEHSTKR